MINYYEVLKITENASENDIKKAYRKLVCRFYPEKTPDPTPFLSQITTAYEILSDPHKRVQYDIKRVGPIKNANLVGERTNRYVVPSLLDIGLFFVKQSFDLSQLKTKLPQEIYEKLNKDTTNNSVPDKTLVFNNHNETNLIHNNINNLDCRPQ